MLIFFVILFENKNSQMRQFSSFKVHLSQHPDVEYKEAKKYESIKLSAGRYIVHCYGGQGGRSSRDGHEPRAGGKGAHVFGTLTIEGQPLIFHAFVGGMGQTSAKGPNYGGFNGGGTGHKDGGDAAGGGGGATDLRFDKEELSDRIIVAAGGSGASGFSEGAPGGDLKGRMADGANNKFKESDKVDQINGNADGRGGDGRESGVGGLGGTGSGGGGGYRGGPSSNDYWVSEANSYKAIAHSGSSYISGHPGCTPHPQITFTDTHMVVGEHEGIGKLVIHPEFICSENCHSCESDSQCNTCFSGFLLESGRCVSKCSSGYYQVGIHCYECDSNCETCANSKDHCLTCSQNLLFYKNKCYDECPNKTMESGNKCLDCDDTCASCSISTDHCDTCSQNLLFYKNKCYDECPNKTMKSGNKCLDCDDTCASCSMSPDHCLTCSQNLFFYNNKCYDVSQLFSSSNHFTQSLNFLISSPFTPSCSFSESRTFTQSSLFTKSKAFSPSKLFAKSQTFPDSESFTSSNIFSHSNGFAKSQHFKASSLFSLSLYFTDISLFSNGQVFTPIDEISGDQSFTENINSKSESEQISTDEYTSMTSYSDSNYNSETISSSSQVVDIHYSTQFDSFNEQSESPISSENNFNDDLDSISMPNIEFISPSSVCFTECNNEKDKMIVDLAPKKKGSISTGVIICIAIAGLVAVSVAAFLTIFLMKRRNKEKKSETYETNEKSSKENSTIFNVNQNNASVQLDQEEADLNFWL